jgi:integrase
LKSVTLGEITLSQRIWPTIQGLRPSRCPRRPRRVTNPNLAVHALAGGRSLAEVRDAAGHRNISTTSLYTHVTTDDDSAVGALFEFDEVPANPDA